MAADARSPMLVDLLVSRGAQVNGRNAHGETPLFYAADDSACTRRLLELGADITAKNQKGQRFRDWSPMGKLGKDGPPPPPLILLTHSLPGFKRLNTRCAASGRTRSVWAAQRLPLPAVSPLQAARAQNALPQALLLLLLLLLVLLMVVEVVLRHDAPLTRRLVLLRASHQARRLSRLQRSRSARA